MIGKNSMYKIGQKSLEPYRSICVVAETASSHEGSLDLLKELTHRASAAKSDAIKYQFLNADSLLVSKHPKYSAFKQLQFSEDQWRSAVEYARSLGLSVIAEVFDEKSAELALDLDVSAVKIPTSDLANFLLLEKFLKFKNPLILSMGAATEDEILFAVQFFEKHSFRNLVLSHGFQNYPTKIEDTLFCVLDYLKTNFHYPIAFADHVDADSPLAFSIPLASIGFGVTLLEKHITSDRSKKGRDYFSALNPDEFSKFVEQVRSMEQAYGSQRLGESEAERSYRKVMKKKIVARQFIPKGQMISLEHVCFRRTLDEGLTPNQYQEVLGRALNDIPQDSIIQIENVEK